MEIYEKIKALREDNDKTQAEIAKVLGTSFQYYQKYEKGKHPIPLQHLKTLCEYYHVSANYLLNLPETYDRTKEETLERSNEIRKQAIEEAKNPAKISREAVAEILRWAEYQQHIHGDINCVIQNIYEHEE